MKTLKSCCFLLLFLLAIGLSSSTALACVAPTSVQHGSTTDCYGSGYSGDLPAGMSYGFVSDPNYNSTYYSFALGSCVPGTAPTFVGNPIYDYVCTYTGGGGLNSCDESATELFYTYWEEFYYVYDDYNYSEMLAYEQVGCWPEGLPDY